MLIKILMSTYNGSKYICEQIESILQQKVDDNVNVRILIRDDGSKDKTVDILKEYMNKYPEHIFLYEGDNIGWKNSFFELIKIAGDADYYAYSDQDDIWLEDKIQTGIDSLKKYITTPALYCCNAKMVDNNMNELGIFEIPRKFDLVDSIIKSRTLGCTHIFNKKLYQLVNELDRYQNIAHDWWTLISCLLNEGMVIADYNCHMLYRQQGNNVYGGENTLLSSLNNVIKDKTNKREYMAKKLMKCYGNKSVFVQNLANYRKEFKCKRILLFSSEMYRGTSLFYRIFFKLQVLLGRA